jgi:hypothetical protein
VPRDPLARLSVGALPTRRRVRPYQRHRAGRLNGLNEGQKITYEVQQDRSKDAVNLKA